MASSEMSDLPFKNTYRLTPEQLQNLDEAEEMMEKHDLTAAEEALLKMLEEDPICVPVLNNLGHLYGKLLSEFEKAVEYYEKVLELEPDNAWARDQRRRYQRYCSYD
jgi:tetratricopeptide (TPR) repeat protein